MKHRSSIRISLVIAAGIIQRLLAADPYCGTSSLDPFVGRIVGGVEVSPHEYPWLVRLYKKDVGFQCGSTLIADRYLLTAGLCLVNPTASSPPENHTKELTLVHYKKFPAEYFHVDLGTHEINESDPLSRQIVYYILHPQFNIYSIAGEEFPVNDIAVLKIDPIEFDYYNIPICLPVYGRILPDKTQLIMAGWGNLHKDRETNQGNWTSVPMAASFVNISPERCKQIKAVDRLVNAADQLGLHQSFCIESETSSTCRGDKGGPVFIYTHTGYELAGIISSTSGCGNPGYCTQVSMYVSFIGDHTTDGVFLKKEDPLFLNDSTLE